MLSSTVTTVDKTGFTEITRVIAVITFVITVIETNSKIISGVRKSSHYLDHRRLFRQRQRVG